MKTSIVPAQITTVEDTFAGNLTLQQIILLIVPFFAGFVAFIILPPNLRFVSYKFAIVAVLAVVFGVLAVRVKGKMLLFWLLTRARYNVRPRYYVYNKADDFLRDAPQITEAPEPASDTVIAPQAEPTTVPVFSIADRVKLEAIMLNPQARLRFKTGKDGRLNVVIQEVK